MKKLVMLALVCGFASLATAGFVLTVDETAQTVSVDGIADQDFYLFLTTDKGIMSFSMGAGAGSLSADTGMSAVDFAAAVGMTIEGDGVAVGFATSPGEAYKDGTYMVGTYGAGATVANLYFFSEVTGESGLLATQIIPEPATMVLLGLGALVLRRKK